MTIVAFNAPVRPVLMVADAAALRASASGIYVNGQVAKIVGVGTPPVWLIWDAASTTDDDGALVFRPSDVGPSSPGRFVVEGQFTPVDEAVRPSLFGVLPDAGNVASAIEGIYDNVSANARIRYSVGSYTIDNSAATTVAAGSDAATLPQATINVASAASLRASGAVRLDTSLGRQTVFYTSKTGTTLEGCSGGSGTLSTGGAVNQTSPLGAGAQSHELPRGSMLNILGAADAVVMNPNIVADANQQLFGGTGSVVFDPPYFQGVSIGWFGSNGDGVADNALVLAKTSVVAKDVVYPVGDYFVSTGTFGAAALTTHHFERGSFIVAFAAGPVTLRGFIDAPPDQQIFKVDARNAIHLPDVSEVHPGWFGGGAGATDDSVAINSAFDACPDGATVVIRPVDHKVTAALSTGARFSIVGSGPESRIVVAAGVGGSVDVLTLAPPVGAFLEGLVWQDFSISPASGTPGRHGIVVDVTADGSAIAQHRISRVRVDQLGGDGIRVVNLPAKADGWFDSTIEDCVTHGGINLINTGDSIRVLGNLCTGTNVGIELQSVALAPRPDSIKKSVATSMSPHTYSGAALDGAIGSTFMTPFSQAATVTTSAHAAQYDTGAAITIHGTDSSNAVVSDTVTPSNTNGGETLTTTQLFKTITSIDVPAQLGTSGAFTFGTTIAETFASSAIIGGNNITGLGGSILVHSGDKVVIRDNNTEHFGTPVGTNGAIDLRGDWNALLGPTVEENFHAVYGTAGPNLINVDNCRQARIARNTLFRGIGSRPDSIKLSIATSASPQTYSGAGLNGITGAGVMSPPQAVMVTTTAHAATYNTGAPIVVHGTDASDGVVSDNLTLTMAGGGETVVGTQKFKTVTSIDVPAQSGILGAFQFGTFGIFAINVTTNAQNTVIEDNSPGPFDVNFIADAGVNTKMWGKYSVGVGPGAIAGQPSAGVVATMRADLGVGNDGTIAIEISENVVAPSLTWLPKTSNNATNDFNITTQGPDTVHATGVNRDSGAIVINAPAPRSGGGVNRPFAIKLAGTTRFQVGDGGATLSCQPGQNTTIGDVDNASILQISPGSGMRLIGYASVVKVSEFETIAQWGQDPVVGDGRDTQPLRFLAQGPDVGASTGSHKDVQGMQFLLPAAGTTGGLGHLGVFDFYVNGGTRIVRFDGDTGNVTILGEVIAASFGAQGFANFTTDQSLTSAALADLLSVTLTTVAGFVEILFTICATPSVAAANFQVVVDGTPVVGGTANLTPVGFSLSASIVLRVAVTAASHTIKVQYKNGAGTLAISPATQFEGASLYVRQS